MYDVVEMFTSINGEGQKAGELAFFIRLKGCNLNCSYCDTQWANKADADYTAMTGEQIVHEIKKEGIKNITVTGGEPLARNGMRELFELILAAGEYVIEIETNGSVDVSPYSGLGERICITMDYKLAGSKMERSMNTDNFALLRKWDTVKFVVSDQKDLQRCYEVVSKYHLEDSVQVYISPVFGQIEPDSIVAFMKEKKWNGVHLQIQMHKVIWDPELKGV